ncbi:MAG TPA: cysteine desulfurase NifS [Pyrinomonadaceae bacterium]|nr:cysteine desulfurase NifS [Pyrinomonadaceae bacterium]
MIYLDNNATTAVAPQVLEAMQPFLSAFFGNPSSAHSLGRFMKQAVEQSREQVANLIGASDPGEIVFTSCGSESDNWAIRGVLSSHPEKKHIVTTLVEHEAVRNLCQILENEGYEVTWLGVDVNGELDLDALRRTLRPDTAVVSIMLANNETGVLFPIDEIGRLVREKSNAVFHVDGVQAVGKIPLDLKNLDVDLFALSGHKFHAPQGVGALYVRNGIDLPSFLIGGGQEEGRRAGTSAVPNIVGLGAACQLAAADDDRVQIERLRDRLEDGILERIPNARVNGARERTKRLPNTANISFEYVEGQNILAHLDQDGICVSTGSACHSSAHESSPTLKAMNIPFTAARGSIRFSLGRYNTEAEIDYTLQVLPDIIAKLAEMSPYDQELRGLFNRQ